MLISHKRAFLARLFGGMGILSLLERFARRPSLLVLGYHRIGMPENTPFYEPIFSATSENFAYQVRYLRDHYRMVGPEVLSSLIAGEFQFTEPTALITFDDGYRDNYDLALPVLRQARVPAAFFVTTEFVCGVRLAWWDHVACVIKQTQLDRFNLDHPKSVTIDMRTTSRTEAIAAVVGLFLRSPPNDEAQLLAHLEERAEVRVDTAALGRDLFMTWDHIRDLAEAGMIVGSHTTNHFNLSRQSEAEQSFTLDESRRILRQELGRDIVALAYPYGNASDFTQATMRIAREAGYRVAFSCHPKINRPGQVDPFDVHRILVGSSDTSALFRARMALTTAFGSSRL